jgi:hypothetical protein
MSKQRIKVGKVYVFTPVGFDLSQPHSGTPAAGTVVRAIKSPRGMTPLGTMGHCYVESVETGRFLGLVQCASLSQERP